MAITYTESWEKSFSESRNDREVTVEFHVVSDDAVLTPWNYQLATEATSGAAFPPPGAVRPEDPRYFLDRRSAPSFEGPRYAVVTAVYRIGSGGPSSEDDPLNQPTRYRFRPITNSESTDTDALGNPLLNSAGDPFGQSVQGSYNSYIVEAARNEAAFDPAIAVSYHNKLNQATFQLAGKTINPGEALCTGIYPTSAYTLQDPYVEVTYSFEIRERLTLRDGTRVPAFVYRLLDQGRQAWIAEDDKKVGIYLRNGKKPNPAPVQSDILLDNGAPIGEPNDGGNTYWSVDPGFDPKRGKGWAQRPQVIVPPLLAIERIPVSGDEQKTVSWLIYQKYIETDFNGLNL